MTDNDIIAEYVMQTNPELIRRIDFVKFRLNKIVEADKRSIAEAFEKLRADANETDPVPVKTNEPYYEYLKQRGIEYCQKNCGTQQNLCGRCPLAFNFCCINQEGLLVINDDTIDPVTAVAQVNYMIEEVTKIEQDKTD